MKLTDNERRAAIDRINFILPGLTDAGLTRVLGAAEVEARRSARDLSSGTLAAEQHARERAPDGPGDALWTDAMRSPMLKRDTVMTDPLKPGHEWRHDEQRAEWCQVPVRAEMSVTTGIERPREAVTLTEDEEREAYQFGRQALTETKARTVTLSDLRADPAAVTRAASEPGGVVVTDDEGVPQVLVTTPSAFDREIDATQETPAIQAARESLMRELSAAEADLARLLGAKSARPVQP